MTLRVKIVLISLITVAGLLVVFSIISVVRYFQGGQKQAAPIENTNTNQLGITQGTTPSPSPIPDQVVPPPSPAKPGEEITSLVLPFVERFGSYSNQSSFESLSDLLPFMTDTMRSWAEAEIKKQKEKPFQDLYRGITTKALSYTLSSYEPEKRSAEMKVTTQRRELIGSAVNARIYNQDVVVTLMKNDGVWLVDSAFWQ